MSIEWRRRALTYFALIALCSPADCEPGMSERTFQGGRLGSVALFLPDGTPDALVFVFSDLQGWDAAYTRAARALATRGAVVIGVDLREYLRRALRA